MRDAVVVLIVLAAGTYAMKSAGPLLLGGRRLPPPVQTVVDLLPAALLAALAAVSTLGDGRALVLDARAVGMLAAGVALARRVPFVLVIVIASAATAATRLVSEGG